MKTAIVYYSQGGNTALVAEKLAAVLGADLVRLEPQKAYPAEGFRKFFWGGKSAVMAETPALLPYSFDAAKYDTVVFGFPVWAGNVTPPLRTFIRENDLRGLRLAALVCQSGAGAEKALGRLREALGVEQLEAEAILIDPKARPTPENEKKIAAFCDQLKAKEKNP